MRQPDPPDQRMAQEPPADSHLEQELMEDILTQRVVHYIPHGMILIQHDELPSSQSA
ncbi:hypothetical protein SDC9_167718 [bioreactor metagenome]|uniref:Uncharacterized protein n=1 Tax=bioreactor metagenome TaxID=1076179 RepID=A0A645G355_9ZZZZ